MNKVVPSSFVFVRLLIQVNDLGFTTGCNKQEAANKHSVSFFFSTWMIQIQTLFIMQFLSDLGFFASYYNKINYN